MSPLLEMVVECIECSGIRVLQISGERQIKELFVLCPACKVLAQVV